MKVVMPERLAWFGLVSQRIKHTNKKAYPYLFQED